MKRVVASKIALLFSSLFGLGMTATHRESVPVKEEFNGQTVWEGIVEVFDLHGHPKTNKAYAWSQDADNPDKPTYHVTVLHLPPGDIARDSSPGSSLAGVSQCPDSLSRSRRSWEGRLCRTAMPRARSFLSGLRRRRSKRSPRRRQKVVRQYRSGFEARECRNGGLGRGSQIRTLPSSAKRRKKMLHSAIISLIILLCGLAGP